MLALPMGFFGTLGENLKATLHFFSSDNRFPVSPDGLGRDACFGADDPTGIEPVVKVFGQCVDGGDSLSTAKGDKWPPAAVFVTPLVKLLADLFERAAVSEKQVPSQAPDLELLRVRFNPAGVSSLIRLGGLIDPLLDVEVAIGCQPDEAAAAQFGVQATHNPLTEFHRLAAGEGEGQADHDAIVGVHRIEVRVVGKADADAQLVQLVNGGQRLGVITPKTFGIFDRDVRELACACIFQQPLVSLTV